MDEAASAVLLTDPRDGHDSISNAEAEAGVAHAAAAQAGEHEREQPDGQRPQQQQQQLSKRQYKKQKRAAQESDPASLRDPATGAKQCFNIDVAERNRRQLEKKRLKELKKAKNDPGARDGSVREWFANATRDPRLLDERRYQLPRHRDLEKISASMQVLSGGLGRLLVTMRRRPRA